MPCRSRRSETGFTLVEVIIVLAIAGVLVAVATPSFTRWREDQRLKTTGRLVVMALSFARSEAIRTGNNHIVFVKKDTVGATLQDSSGSTVDIAVINDHRPGDASQNCLIDAGETVAVVNLEDGVDFGISDVAVTAPSTDFGGDFLASGASFTQPDNTAATWVLFRSDGTPITFAADCSLGKVGSGSGAIYFENGIHDMTAIVTPLGSFQLLAWNSVSNEWSK